jgi:hypothetical protein
MLRKRIMVPVVGVMMLIMSSAPALAVGKAQCGIGAPESEGATNLEEVFGGLFKSVGEATSSFAHNQKASGSNVGLTVGFEPAPPATQCSPATPASPLSR